MQFNPEQLLGITTVEGPCLISAGAGSGKTSVLTHRIAHLMQKHQVPAYAILALTFTNKAAQEMKQRVAQLLHAEEKKVPRWLGTFHSVFGRILRYEAAALGYTHDFTIYDREDSLALLKTIIKALKLSDKYQPPRMLKKLAWAKQHLQSAADYAKDPTCRDADIAAGIPHTSTVLQQYTTRCQGANAMDFDDLLFNTYRLFRLHPAILEKYQNKFQFVLVDEFQDTNQLQYAILQLLAAQHGNLCVVGDDAQSIYAFRGASVQNILNFQKDYPAAKHIRLTQNYRSTKAILTTANKLIAHNAQQLKKDLWTANDAGKPPMLHVAFNERDEARQVIQQIYATHTAQHIALDQFAILYRTNTQSRPLEEALRKAGLPYRIFGGLSFYQRKEIKDMLAYLRLLVNPNDEAAFKRIINLPKRGLGAMSVAKIIAAAQANQQSLLKALVQAPDYLTPRLAKSALAFAQIFTTIQTMLDTHNAYEVALAMVHRSGMWQALQQDTTLQGTTRHDHVKELLASIQAYVKHEDTVDHSLAAFLQEVALFTTQDQKTTQKQITLMTIHMAKGLEFDNVYITGLEENLFPSQRMVYNQQDLEEERRLFYVALTRARKSLNLFYASSRNRYGTVQYNKPSRFIKEISSALQTFVPPSTVSPSQFSKLPPMPDAPYLYKKLKEGMRVIHPKFGKGILQQLDLDSSRPSVVVAFKKVGEKKLILKFANLRFIDTL